MSPLLPDMMDGVRTLMIVSSKARLKISNSLSSTSMSSSASGWYVPFGPDIAMVADD